MHGRAETAEVVCKKYQRWGDRRVILGHTHGVDGGEGISGPAIGDSESAEMVTLHGRW